ncbi:MAG: GTPase [Ignisphaera sp.]
MRLLRNSEIDAIVSRSDIVIEIVEARNPLETKSRIIESVARKKERRYILVLNKCDLVPRYVCGEWIDYFRELGISALCTSSIKRIGIKELKHMLINFAGNKKTINVSVFGLPKVGKSSLINALKGKDSALTSPYPGSWGYTKGITLYKILPGIYLIDTPGFVPPDAKGFEVLIRSRPIDLIPNPIAIAKEIITKIMYFNPISIEIVYGLATTDYLKLLEHIAIKRGWFYKTTKEPNIDEAAKTVIRDYLNGKLTFYLHPPTRDFIDSR